MSKGRIEQIGTAEDLYQRPDSLFVASFIGSPPINLIEGTAGQGRIRLGDADLPCPPATTGRVIAGIRPEDLQLAAGDMPSRIEDLEPHGRETIYHLATPLGRLHALEAGAVARFKVGDEPPVTVASALFFDAVTSRRIAA
jgi:ABC-type sugar transport system ATPase subunit